MRSYNDYIQNSPRPLGLWDFAKLGDVDAFEHEKLLNPSLDLTIKDAKGYSALMYAAYHNHVELVKWLLAEGVDIESADAGGNTVLMGAAFKGHLEVVQLLLTAGANPKAQNFLGMSVLQFAQMFGRHEVATLLAGEQKKSFERKIQQLKIWCFYIKQKLQNKKELGL